MMNYDEVFSPVAKPMTIRVLLSLVVMYKWPIRKLHFHNIFLHGILHKEVYMTQPPVFANPQYPNYMCKLNEVLYGVKQAPLSWSQCLTIHTKVKISKHNFWPTASAQKYGQCITILLVYMDDIIVTANHTPHSLLSSSQQELFNERSRPTSQFLG